MNKKEQRAADKAAAIEAARVAEAAMAAEADAALIAGKGTAISRPEGMVEAEAQAAADMQQEDGEPQRYKPEAAMLYDGTPGSASLRGSLPTPEDAPTETPAAKPAKTPKAPMTVTLADGTVKTLPALPKAAKKARKPKPGLPCSCGCGGTTKGGRFLTGHDSYLKSWCLRVERGTVTLADIPDDGIRAAVAAHMTPAKTAE